ncbi:hypothetical protein OTU49_016069 [Cherax quadricarinatus]|uniref:Chitin-binding type-2 domain-containing protein n=1 Tax=Cherax quadricarinatus TaxID=27406 RepID=A0AAW0Y9F5_CHEQU
MKSLLVVAVCGAFLLEAAVGHASGYDWECDESVSALCPEVDPALPVYLANPDDCRAFCECSAGTAYIFLCDPGLLYNDVLEMCDWADDVDCGNRPYQVAVPADVPGTL